MLLDTHVLVMDQVTSFMSNDFAIHDATGRAVGRVHTEGSGVARFFGGARHLTVHDTDGRPLLRVDDTLSFGKDRFALVDPAAGRVAEVVQQFTLFRKRITTELVTGEVLELTGSFFEREFEVTGPLGAVARVSRSWPDIGAALLGKNRYAVGFNAGVPAHLRLAVVGTVIALDLIRAKESAAAASS